MNDKHRQALKDALQRKKEKLPAHAGFTHFDSFPDNALVRQPVVLALTGMSRATGRLELPGSERFLVK